LDYDLYIEIQFPFLKLIEKKNKRKSKPILEIVIKVDGKSLSF